VSMCAYPGKKIQKGHTNFLENAPCHMITQVGLTPHWQRRLLVRFLRAPLPCRRLAGRKGVYYKEQL
jgi:hypothetical protein